MKNEMPDLRTKICNPNLYYQSGVRIPRGEIKITLQDHLSPTFLAEELLSYCCRETYKTQGHETPTKKSGINEDEMTIRIINQPPKKVNHNDGQSANEIESAPSKLEGVHESERSNGMF